MIIAHRGFRKNGEPDNSIPAFHSAIKSFADGLEFDIQITSDRKFVVFHDSTLVTLGIPKPINEITFNEVISLELAEGINIPSLEEVLGTFGNKTLLNIEFKPKEDGVEELVSLIHKFKLKKDPRNLIVSSYDSNSLKKIKSLDPKIPTGLLVYFSRNQVKNASSINCDAIHPFYEVIPDGWSKLPRRISRYLHGYYINKCFKEARTESMLVNPYTVNSDTFLRKSFENDLHAVITDEVERAFLIRKDFI